MGPFNYAVITLKSGNYLILLLCEYVACLELQKTYNHYYENEISIFVMSWYSTEMIGTISLAYI